METNPILMRERTGVQTPHSDTRLKFLKSAPAMKKRRKEEEEEEEEAEATAVEGTIATDEDLAQGPLVMVGPL